MRSYLKTDSFSLNVIISCFSFENAMTERMIKMSLRRFAFFSLIKISFHYLSC